METDKSEPVGPHVLIYFQDELTLHVDIQGCSPEQLIYFGELLRRHAGKMLDYRETQAEATSSKRRLVLPS